METTNMAITLQTLPGELQNHIIKKLDFDASLHLSQTNHYFYNIVDLTSKPCSALSSVNTYRIIARPQHDGHKLCWVCYYIKPNSCFEEVDDRFDRRFIYACISCKYGTCKKGRKLAARTRPRT